MPTLRLTLAAGAAVCCVLAATGCASRERTFTEPPATATASPTPDPTVTIVRTAHSLRAGQGTSLTAQAGVSMRLTASRPSVSRTRLSSSYGYAPARGYYVTFVVTVVNTGSSPLTIGPTNFHVRIAGEGVVTTYSGNAPYSGASEQLDATQLDPGQSVRGPVTFDVRRPHGVLSYLPDRSAAVNWTF